MTNLESFNKEWIAKYILQLSVVILVLGVFLGFGANKLIGYFVDSQTALEFSQVNDKIKSLTDSQAQTDKRVDSAENKIASFQNLDTKIAVFNVQLDGMSKQLDAVSGQIENVRKMVELKSADPPAKLHHRR